MSASFISDENVPNSHDLLNYWCKEDLEESSLFNSFSFLAFSKCVMLLKQKVLL